ncbi:hypothetical protein PybrP1_007023, partial [[Pythium] brassicae (nom. inval.)]
MTHRQPPCLICGTSGHLARTCNVSSTELKSKHCIISTQADLQRDTPKAASFGSAKKMRDAFAKPTRGQEQAHSQPTEQQERCAGAVSRAQVEQLRIKPPQAIGKWIMAQRKYRNRYKHS